MKETIAIASSSSHSRSNLRSQYSPKSAESVEIHGHHHQDGDDGNGNGERHVLSMLSSPVDYGRSSIGRGEAVFKRRHEASSIELFLDLFFVANLTVFTKEHEIKSGKELASYIGFFSILWCTWLQIALYDVRFSTNSVFARFCKACHVGIMMGFAVAIPRWDTTDTSSRSIRSYRIIDLILVSSRFLLVVQLLEVTFFARRYRRTRNQLVALMGVLFVSGCIFLGLFFAFPEAGVRMHSEIGLYVVSGVEVVFTLAVSMVSKGLSFKHTHLVERLGLLTLIIIGEGIIGMALAIAKVLDVTLYVGQFGGLLISGVLIIYFLYLLYFDQLHPTSFSTLRMHIWTLLHFPLHVAYLLTVESIGQLVVWGTLNDQTDLFTKLLDSIFNPLPPTIPDLIKNLNTTLLPWLASLSGPTSSGTLRPLNLTNAFDELSHQHDVNSTEAGDIIADIVLESLDFLFERLQVEPPKEARRAATVVALSEEQRAEDIINVFVTIFYYTFAAAGAALLMLGVLHWIGIRRKNAADFWSIGVKAVVGLGMGLVTLLAVVRRKPDGDLSDAFGNFYTSPWVLPTVMLAFGVVLVSHNTIFHLYYRRRRHR